MRTEPLLSFSPAHVWTVQDSFEGFLGAGSTGSGKSSTSGKAVAIAMLRAGFGGLVLCAKRSEIDTWISYCKEAGREDPIVFTPESGHQFDPLFYEWNAGNRNVESLVEFFSTILSIGKKHADTSADQFWERSIEEKIRIGAVMLDMALERLSIGNLDRLFRSFPTQPGEYETASWQDSSYCAGVLNLIRDRRDTLSVEQWEDLDHATFYACIKWPSMDERTRSNIAATWSGLASKVQFNPMNRIFNSGACTFIPEMATHQGRVIICGFPVLQMNELGRLVNCMIKYTFQRAWLRRDVNVAPNPVFLFADEAQFFLLPKGRDNAFQQVCRSHRVSTVYLTQNVMQIAEEFGEHHLGPKTKGFLANIVTKVCHTQSCFDTNEYMSNLIGKEYKHLKSQHIGGGSISLGKSEHLMHRVEPDFFTRLRKPDFSNPVAECVVYQGGRLFGDQPFIVTQFSR